MSFTLVHKQKTSGTGSTDWTIPEFATHVEVIYNPSEEAIASHTISFRDASSLIANIALVETVGGYRFFNVIPKTATIVRVTNGGAGPSTVYRQIVNFIVEI